MASRVDARRPHQTALLAAVLTWLGLLLVAPLLAVAWHLAELGLGDAFRQIDRLGGLEALARSVGLAAGAVAINGVLGILGAIVLVRHRFPGRSLLDWLVDLPLAVSPVMIGLAFILLLGRDGLLAPLLSTLELRVVFAWPGLLLATVFVTVPFTIREVGNVLREVGTAEEEAAHTLGASSWQTFTRITLPNVRHGLTYGATLTTSRALGEFGAVLVLGGAISGQTDTATTFIYAATEARFEAAAYGMALLLAGITMLLLAALKLAQQTREG